MIVAPSDHVVFKENVFQDNVNTAIKAASGSEKLIALGIVPTRPETGYGYIQFHSNALKKVKSKTFTEKPELELAKKFIDSGDFECRDFHLVHRYHHQSISQLLKGYCRNF